jgi:hypothetical protein
VLRHQRQHIPWDRRVQLEPLRPLLHLANFLLSGLLFANAVCALVSRRVRHVGIHDLWEWGRLMKKLIVAKLKDLMDWRTKKVVIEQG